MDEPDQKAGDATHVLRSAPGRETRYVRRDGRAAIEKRFTGGSRWDDWRDRLAGSGPRAPARREREALAALRAAGVAVPEPLALHEEGGRSSLSMEYVAHEETLADRLAVESAPARRALGERLLELVLRLHGAGWYHRDLYLEHVLLRSADGALVLIDLGRARRDAAPRQRWFEKDVAAMEHSAPAAVTRRERLRFLAGYLDGRGMDERRERRRFAAAVGRRAAKMARHRPRHGVSHDLPPEARR